ncbi:MAG: hypothetical protein BWY59_00129 [Verrucomicrobia bacterium ADurb.Bin345]|nr:MAG: hypothetical protein BWY59_00129 [Verrucomicrobia bacterium ADurb.Bin345]
MLRTRALVKIVHVLRRDLDMPSCFLPSSQRQMRAVRLGCNHLGIKLAREPVEVFRVAMELTQVKDIRVSIVGVKAGSGAKIRDAGSRGNARAAQHRDVSSLANKIRDPLYG